MIERGSGGGGGGGSGDGDGGGVGDRIGVGDRDGVGDGDGGRDRDGIGAYFGVGFVVGDGDGDSCGDGGGVGDRDGLGLGVGVGLGDGDRDGDGHATRARVIVALALAVSAAACTGEVGTFNISLVTAPGSTVLDPVTRLRATLGVPRRVVEAERQLDGTFHLELEVPADGHGTAIIVEGLDAGGVTVAIGATPPLPIAAIDADIAIYLAAPMSVAAAPVALDPARSEIGATLLSYGVMLAGGRNAAGNAVADLDIYNAYTHAIEAGEDMPGPRRGIAVAASSSGFAYLFGGADDTAATGTFWRFDTDAAPDGNYALLDDVPEAARAGEVAAPLGFEQFLVTGTPPIIADGFAGAVGNVNGILGLPPVAISVQLNLPGDERVFTIAAGSGAGATGLVQLANGLFTEIGSAPDPLRTGHGIVPTPDDDVVVIGGAVAGAPVNSAFRYRPVNTNLMSYSDVLGVPRIDAAIATNGELIVVAGGTDAGGSVLGDLEVLELDTLDRVASLPLLVPRTGAIARSLNNGQILIAGGVDATGAPVATIELFTPFVAFEQ